jgi:hypothetical protein
MAIEPAWAFHDTVTRQQDEINEARNARRQAETGRTAEQEDPEPEREFGGR